MNKTYYIDGYNVLHQARHLKELARMDFESAREALIDKIALHTNQQQCEAVIVFDGRHAQRVMQEPHHRSCSRLHVRYAPAHSTADTVIEREVYKTEHRLTCVVVSNDRGLRDLCRGMGALVMEAGHYLESLSELQRDLTDTLRQTQTTKPVFLEDQISPDMAEQLRQLKEKLK